MLRELPYATLSYESCARDMCSNNVTKARCTTKHAVAYKPATAQTQHLQTNNRHSLILLISSIKKECATLLFRLPHQLDVTCHLFDLYTNGAFAVLLLA